MRVECDEQRGRGGVAVVFVKALSIIFNQNEYEEDEEIDFRLEGVSVYFGRVRTRLVERHTSGAVVC